MTTTTISIVKPAGGGDYTTLQTWYAGRVGILGGGNPNLITLDRIEVAVVYGGGDALNGLTLTLNTCFTDATHYFEIRAAAGHQHNGTWDISKAYGTTPSGTSILCLSQNLHITGMQISSRDITVSDSEFLSLATGVIVDRCILKSINNTGVASAAFESSRTSASSSIHSIVQNSILIALGVNALGIWNRSSSTTIDAFNNTIITSATNIFGAIGSYTGTGQIVNSQNNYLQAPTGCCYKPTSGTINKGSKDATSTTEATDPNLRNVPYTTATFLNVTPGSENLRPVISSSNRLLDHGANLTSSGITIDIVGTARPQFGTFDIGAFENDIPICWNYTAHYKNSNKLFKASGCGSFPKNLRVPSNVDVSTGRMVDDGIFINPDEYRVI